MTNIQIIKSFINILLELYFPNESINVVIGATPNTKQFIKDALINFRAMNMSNQSIAVEILINKTYLKFVLILTYRSLVLFIYIKFTRIKAILKV